MSANERIAALRSEMKKEGVDIYYIPTTDFHETEYVGEHFKCREYISGFTGSAGIVIVTELEAGLWTDGRYYTQAEKQLEGTEIVLYRAGMTDVPATEDYIRDNIPEKGCLGFDGRVVNAAFAEKLKAAISKKGCSLKTDIDLVGRIWTDRPPVKVSKITDLSLERCGISRTEKMELIREDMKKSECEVHILSTLDNICWLLNIRGEDVVHFPVITSFFVMDNEKALLFVHDEAVTDEIREVLLSDGIAIKSYEEIYGYVSGIRNSSILIDTKKVNSSLLYSIDESNRICDSENPEVLHQSIKNSTELSNIKNAHIKDGIACTRFMYYLKKNIGKIPMTEYSAEKYLDGLRRELPGYMDLSFDTISAYGANAAMMHYSAEEDNSAVLEQKGFLLVDSGAHYIEGTTDITRTYALGELSYKEKQYYTAVLQGNMRLAAAKFLHGCRGVNLDILARGPIWELGADYRCGTGHGVGYCLNVHEAPNGFRWKIVNERNDSCILEAGQVTTDEPGYYEPGAFGIRIENELLCVELEKNEYGQFMGFETITYAPIDMEPVLVDMLTKRDRELINSYHLMVRKVLSPYFSGDELEFLIDSTKEV